MSNSPQPKATKGIDVQVTVAIIGAIAIMVAAVIGILPNFLNQDTQGISNDTPVATQQVAPTTNPNSPAAETTPSSRVVLFSDSFSDNSNGWTTNPSVTVTGNKLQVTANQGEWVWIPIPNLQVDGNFYIEAEMNLVQGHNCFSHMGFALGEAEVSSHRFITMGSCSQTEIAYYDNSSLIYNRPSSGLMRTDRVYTLGLESKDGEYTLYVDGKPAESVNLMPYGNAIGIFVWRTEQDVLPRETTVTVDNILVRQAR
jgi:hypothetical protein